MRLSQLDRIVELVPGERLVAVKTLSLSEDYLQDHFPRFPVMPGVLMLESMFQAGMWLIYATRNFRHSSVVLCESRQVKFGDFVEPGSQLRVHADWKQDSGERVVMEARGTVGDSVAVRGKLVLEYFDLAARGLASPQIDEYLIQERLRQFRRLQDPRNPYNSGFAGSQPSLENGQIG
jgi:3-hydroxyacyl-[acyl-carrier-protein] dehydratase